MDIYEIIPVLPSIISFSYPTSVLSHLSSHYITVTQIQYILTISIALELRQTKQALINVNLQISQPGRVLINISYALTKV